MCMMKNDVNIMKAEKRYQWKLLFVLRDWTGFCPTSPFLPFAPRLHASPPPPSEEIPSFHQLALANLIAGLEPRKFRCRGRSIPGQKKHARCSNCWPAIIDFPRKDSLPPPERKWTSPLCRSLHLVKAIPPRFVLDYICHSIAYITEDVPDIVALPSRT